MPSLKMLQEPGRGNFQGEEMLGLSWWERFSHLCLVFSPSGTSVISLILLFHGWFQSWGVLELVLQNTDIGDCTADAQKQLRMCHFHKGAGVGPPKPP